MTKILDEDRARQARLGRPVLYVLAGSLLLAGLYLVSMVGWSGLNPTPPATQTQSPASTDTAPSR